MAGRKRQRYDDSCRESQCDDDDDHDDDDDDDDDDDADDDHGSLSTLVTPQLPQTGL